MATERTFKELVDYVQVFFEFVKSTRSEDPRFRKDFHQDLIRNHWAEIEFFDGTPQRIICSWGITLIEGGKE
jgi:hypothetical protein